MGKHVDFRISSFQVIDARQILQFNRKTEQRFKEFMVLLWGTAVRKSQTKWPIGPFQLAIHVLQNRHAGEQKSHWDKTNNIT